MLLKKTANIDERFSWLSLLSNNSVSYEKIEIYDFKNKCEIKNLQNLIYKLFNDDRRSLVIGPCATGIPWNDFADIVEEIENYEIPIRLDSKYDNEFEVRFMKMMVENGIEYDYKGYCEILNWNQLLDLVLSIVINVKGTDSLKFYNIDGSYCFYPHYTCSIGVYYKEMNEKIDRIIRRANRMGACIEYIKE